MKEDDTVGLIIILWIIGGIGGVFLGLITGNLLILLVGSGLLISYVYVGCESEEAAKQAAEARQLRLEANVNYLMEKTKGEEKP